MIQNLPNDYSRNLADLPTVQRAAVERDKARWHECNKRYSAALNAGKKGRALLDAWLSAMTEADQLDHRRRLNAIQQRRRGV